MIESLLELMVGLGVLIVILGVFVVIAIKYGWDDKSIDEDP